MNSLMASTGIRWQALAGCFILASCGWFVSIATADSKGTAVADASAASAVGMDAGVLDRIDDRMREFVDAKQAAGIVTLVARQGKVVHLAAVGESDIETHKPMATDTIFSIASMTKPIASTALMILVDEKKVSLDDPVSKYIPEFANIKLKSGPPSRPVTVRDAITHTSGLTGDQNNQGTLAETAAKMATRELKFEPGSKWEYGPGITIVGRIVEVASGMPFEKFLSQRLFEPLGMNETTFNPTSEQQARIAKLYQPSKDGKGLTLAAPHWINEVSATRTPNPSAGLFSTASDLARFYQLVLNGGELDGKRILSKDAIAEMTRIQTGDLKVGFTDGNGWGLGWCVVRNPQGVTKMLSPGSHGHGGAFGTQGWIDPGQEMFFVMLVQRSGFGNGDQSDIRNALQQIAVDAKTK